MADQVLLADPISRQRDQLLMLDQILQADPISRLSVPQLEIGQMHPLAQTSRQ